MLFASVGVVVCSFASFDYVDVDKPSEYTSTHDSEDESNQIDAYTIQDERQRQMQLAPIIDTSNYTDESCGIEVISEPAQSQAIEQSVVSSDDFEIIEFESTTSYYGEFTLTAYTSTGNACADGVWPTSNHTAASSDPALWHKWIWIEGIGDLYVHDTGGMPSNVIDIFMDSYNDAIQFGSRSASVYIYP